MSSIERSRQLLVNLWIAACEQLRLLLRRHRLVLILMLLLHVL